MQRLTGMDLASSRDWEKGVGWDVGLGSKRLNEMGSEEWSRGSY